MKKKLAIIRADDSQLPLVTKAKEMGIETHCFAWDREGYTQCKEIADYFYPISILEKEQILEKCKEIEIDGVTSILSDNAVPTVAYVAQGMGLIGNRYEDMLILRSKYKARQTYFKKGINSPRFALAQEDVDLTGFKYPLIVKPVDRCDSDGAIKIEKEEDLQAAILHAKESSYSKEVLIEEFITGLEVSIDSISWNGVHYIMAIKEREMIIIDNYPEKIAGHYPFDLPQHIHAKIIEETQKALNSINYKYGASNTEFRLTDEGELFVLEVNPRMAGEKSHILMNLYNGYDVVKGVIDVALGQFTEPVFPYKKYSGIYYCRKNTEWIRKVIENKENDADIIEGDFYEKEFSEISGRTGYFIYQSDYKRRWEQNHQ